MDTSAKISKMFVSCPIAEEQDKKRNYIVKMTGGRQRRKKSRELCGGPFDVELLLQ